MQSFVVAAVSSSTLLVLLCLQVNGQYIHPYDAISPPYYQQQQMAIAAPKPGIVYDESASNPRHLAHPAVVRNAAAEAQLPQDLVNPFYKNPQVAAGLARESWFTDKEFPVLNRQADKISRSEIAKIVRRIEHKERK